MKHRAEFMSNEQKAKIPFGTVRTHSKMIQYTGVARPGKTAKDKALRSK